MPQKRNPYALSIIRGRRGVLIGRLTGFLAVAKSPSARSDNLIFAYGEVPRALDLALRVTRLMTGVVRTLQVNADRMRAALDAGFSQATDLAEYIMQTCGVDYRSAYQVVGRAVRQASAAGLRGVDIDGAMLDAAAAEVTGPPARPGRPGPVRGAGPAADRGHPDRARRRRARRGAADGGRSRRGGEPARAARRGAGGTPTAPPRTRCSTAARTAGAHGWRR